MKPRIRRFVPCHRGQSRRGDGELKLGPPEGTVLDLRMVGLPAVAGPADEELMQAVGTPIGRPLPHLERDPAAVLIVDDAGKLAGRALVREAVVVADAGQEESA